MRHRSLRRLLLGVCISAWPPVACASDLSEAHRAFKKGDLHAAQINLRNAVRADPQNAEAHYDLAQVSFGLGDAVAAEREAEQALERGFDPHLAVRLLAQGLVAQGKFDTLLQKLQPGGKDTSLAKTIPVFRGYAQIGLRQFDAPQKPFAAAEQKPRTASSHCWRKRSLLCRATILPRHKRRLTRLFRNNRSRSRRFWPEYSFCV
jgi:cellulose synthase operon protein C